MRSTSACFGLGILVLAAHAHAEGSFSGSILRLDEQTYRVVIQANVPLSSFAGLCSEDGQLTCCWPHESAMGVKGPFGLPSNESPGTDFMEGSLEWFLSLQSIPEVQFDFAVSPSQQSPMPFECFASRTEEGDCSVPQRGSYRVFIGGLHSETVYGVLPTRVGDSAPLRPTVAVQPTPWSAVKQLYRD